MRLRTLLCGLLALSVSASCGNIVMRSQRIAWPPLLKDGCPDLSGQYSGRLYGYITAAVDFVQPEAGRIITTGYAHQTISNPYWQRTASEASSTTVIQHSPTTLVVVLRNGKGRDEVKSEIRLDTPMTGCRDGALVLRRERRTGGVEGSGASLEWSEDEIRRSSDGSVVFTGRGARQTYGGLTGMTGRTDWYLPGNPVPGIRGETFPPKTSPGGR